MMILQVMSAMTGVTFQPRHDSSIKFWRFVL